MVMAKAKASSKGKKTKVEKKVVSAQETVKEEKVVKASKKETPKTTKSTKKTAPKKTTKKVGLGKRIRLWFKAVIGELKKVKWPSKKDMVKYSIATIVFVLFFSIFFYLIELVVALIKTWM